VQLREGDPGKVRGRSPEAVGYRWLYRLEKVNPLGGRFSMLLQLPSSWLFYALRST
jgi:hypothetical protein